MTFTTAFTKENQGEPVACIVVDGNLTQRDGVQQLAGLMQETLRQQPRILVDLSEVPYIDSAGLAELVHGYTSARSHGGTVKLLRPSGRVDSLLRLTQLHQSFEIYEDEREALASFV